jgi:hypothetical protein
MASPCRRALRRALDALILTALLALAIAPAAAGADTRGDRAALATERYYSSFGNAAPSAADGAALATERYYSSYGTPQPLTKPTVVADVPDGGGPGWIAAILVAAAAAGAGALAGRLSVRPHHAGV